MFFFSIFASSVCVYQQDPVYHPPVSCMLMPTRSQPRKYFYLFSRLLTFIEKISLFALLIACLNAFGRKGTVLPAKLQKETKKQECRWVERCKFFTLHSRRTLLKMSENRNIAIICKSFTFLSWGENLFNDSKRNFSRRGFSA